MSDLIEALRSKEAESFQKYVDANEARIEAEARVEQLTEALRDLLLDTQHKDHDCGDADRCPVSKARAMLEQED